MGAACSAPPSANRRRRPTRRSDVNESVKKLEIEANQAGCDVKLSGGFPPIFSSEKWIPEETSGRQF